MTDVSEPAAPAPAPEPADGPVLARGHLHPSILLLRLFDAVRQVAFLFVIGLFERSFLVIALILFVVNLATSVVRYLTLEYTLTPSELRVREGLLQRQERRIPLDRIQDLGFESTILRRALGLVVVMVETASGRGVEARLDALQRDDAEHLREVLLRVRPVGTGAAAGEGEAPMPLPGSLSTPPEPEPEWLVHRSTTGELVLRGVTDLRLGAFVVTGFAAFEFADQLGVASAMVGLIGDFRDWLDQLPLALTLLLLLALLLLVMAFGVVTATLGNLVQFHGFSLLLRGDVLQRRFGLLTTRQKTLPRARVQRVTIEQTWLRRLLGLSVVKADSAGGSRGDGEDAAGGWDVVVPLTRHEQAHALLPALLPGVERASFTWHRGSRRMIVRNTLQGVVLAAVVVATTAWRFGLGSLVALVLVPLWAVLGLLQWRNLSWARGEQFFVLQHGALGRTFACVPTAKVQAVVVRQGPVAQLLGLADLTVYVAGGSPTRLPNLTLADAEVLAAVLAERAAVAAAADW